MSETIEVPVDEDDTESYIKPFRVSTQGHIHVEAVSLADRRPTLRRWYVQTEQKRPGTLYVFEMDNTVYLSLSADEGTLYLRDGEDGSEQTFLLARLPRTLPWRRWEVVARTEKWGCEVVAFTTSWPTRPMFMLRGHLHRFFSRKASRA